MMNRPHRHVLTKKDHSPLKEAMRINYRADGTGRDTYVVSNSGGLVNDYGHSMPKDALFKKNLRH